MRPSPRKELETKPDAAPAARRAPRTDAKMPAPTLEQLPIDAIARDDANRVVALDDEEFLALLDSIRVLGILQPLLVQREEEGRYRLVEGERRWQAARLADLAEVPCLVWPAQLAPRDLVAAGVAANEHRVAHGCLQVARRLRQLKNEFAETQERIADRTGLPLPRVKLYLGLFGASDALLAFFAEEGIPLRLAIELVRFEKATSEARARALVQRHKKQPLHIAEVARLRAQRTPDAADATPPATAPGRRAGFAARVEAAFRRDEAQARTELEAVLTKLGFALVAAGPKVPS